MSALKQDIGQTEAEKNITVQTSRFGEIVVDKERIISLVNPFLGFPESTRFILKSHSPKSPFMWLQSLDNPQLAFVVLPASFTGLDYGPEIPRSLLKEPSANPLGPIVLNSGKRLAVQVVLDPNKYDPCHPLFPAK